MTPQYRSRGKKQKNSEDREDVGDRFLWKVFFLIFSRRRAGDNQEAAERFITMKEPRGVSGGYGAVFFGRENRGRGCCREPEGRGAVGKNIMAEGRALLVLKSIICDTPNLQMKVSIVEPVKRGEK